MITALAGGVGAARLLSGMPAVSNPADMTVIANTADDLDLFGLRICPDIDTLVYTLAGASNLETGWGIAGETWNAIDALSRFGAPTWFKLGDKDLGTHLYRTSRLEAGATLTDVTDEIARSWNIAMRILPMSDTPVRTLLDVQGHGEISFQDYFVRLAHGVEVKSLRFKGADEAEPGPQVLDAILSAERIIICPSNPIVSIGPILALAPIRKALISRREAVVAVSPIVAGAAIKGPADRLMSELGFRSDVTGVAQIYSEICSTLVIDNADSALAGQVEELGLKCIVTDTIMSSAEVTSELCAKVIDG
ncbi:MAG TPA: 2-phospho-L-lactate transferase [Acidimicrobiales bacterium]|nr:2-phospho-L-lactate transferase [Acidimicrobiales bacterium]